MSVFSGLGKRGQELAKGIVDLIDEPVSAKQYIQQGTNPNFLIQQGLLAPEQINNIRAIQGAQNRYLKNSIQSPEFLMREMGYMNSPTVTSQILQPPRNIIMPEDLEGMVMKSHLGDRTVTDKTIESIGGVDLPEPVQSRGGVGYGSSPLTPKPNYWGSNLGASTSLQNAAEGLEEMFDMPVAGVYAAMGRDANFFNQAFADALHQQVEARDLPQDAIDHFDNAMRTLHGRKDWVGLRHPDARKQLLGTDGYPQKGAGNLRSAYVIQMDKAGYKNQGFPLLQPLMNELIEPDLANVNVGDSGYIMGQIGKDFGLSPNANHPSYDTGIMGRVIGGFPVSVPSRVMYPDAYKILDQALTKAGENYTAAQMINALAVRHDMYQIATPQWVDSVSEWIRKNPQGTAKALMTAVGMPIALGSSEETEASGLVGMVPTIAKKMIDDPNTPKKNNPQGWANYLEKQGAKSTEVDKYNLDLIQTDRQLSKEEVSQYLLDNEYKLGRTLRSQYPLDLDIDVMRANVATELRKQNPDVTDAEISETTQFYLDEHLPLHIGDRSSGNIENYREQVLEDPSGMQINEYINNNVYAQQQITGELRELHNAIKNNGFVLDRVGDDLVKVPMDEMVSRYTKKQIQREHLKRLRSQAENRTFVEASHFPELNVAGHVRTTDRINSFDWRTGKKTQYRLIEEVQSDWVQRAENPDVGVKDIEKMDNLYDAMYESKVAQYKAMANASPDKKEDVFNEYLVEQADISRRLEELGTNNFRSKVPPPPIAKPHIPLVNQTIIDAVEEGMDGIGIVTGETQLVAKDQFQFINDISWKTHKIEGDKEPNILFDFSGITNRQGDVGEVHTQLSMNVKSDLEDFRKLLPKGKADEIIDQVRADIAAGKESGIMSNFNAQVEGKKLRPYYNKTLRKHLEQLGKQYGVKVEKRKNTEEFRIESDDGYHSVVREDGVVMEEFDNLREAQEYYDKRMMAVDDHFYLPFTDKMKEDVKKKGLKLFSAVGITPVAMDAMRANLNNQDQKMQFIYDDRYTQREENRAAIEDMLARDAKTRRREELGQTMTGLLDAPRTALKLAGDVITDTIGGAFQVLPELGVRAVESAVPSLKGTGLGDRFAESFSSLYKSEPRNRKEELIRNQVASNLMDALTAAAPYAQEAYTSGGLLGAPSIQDIVQTAKSGYEQLPEGYVKENLLPAAGYTAAGILSVPYLFGRAPVKAATENLMPQGLLN